MVDAVAIAGAMNSLKIALDLLNGAKAARDTKLIGEALEQIRARLIEAQMLVLEAQQTISALLDSERELKRKLMELEEWEREKQRYEMIEFDPGRIVYRVKEAARGAEPVHYACPSCFQKGQKSIMQARSYYGQVFVKCPVCELDVATDRKEPFRL